MILGERFLDVACGLGRAGGVVLNFHLLSAREVRSVVDLLGPRFDLIHHDDLPARLARGGGARRPFCLLTFDDGKRANATETAPALAALGVPAVFYVVTGFLSDGTRPLWFDRLNAIERRLGVLPPDLDREVLKRLPHALRDERVGRACARLDVDADMSDDAVRPMSWAEARALAGRGFTIGAHSEWHAILPNEPLDSAREDIDKCMHAVTEGVGAPCRTFSFPNGNYTATLCRHAHERGAATVMTTEPMWTSGPHQRLRLPRVQLAAAEPPARRALKLAVARVPSVLQNPDGTGRLYAPIEWLSRRSATS